MFSTVGVADSAGVAAGLIAGVSLVPMIFLHLFGGRWRQRRDDKDVAEKAQKL